MSSGTMLARTFSRLGYHVMAVNDYPSLIRGGHNIVTVRISTEEFGALNRDVHILVALNKKSVELHKDELGDGALVIFDPNDHEWKPEDFSTKVILLPLPLKEIVGKLGAESVMRNTICLGATVALLGMSFDHLGNVIKDQFLRKGEAVVTQNLAIAKTGFDYVKEHFASDTSMYLGAGKSTEELLVVNGSEAVGIGAVRAGLKFAAIYPMTPINSLITFLADHAKSLKLVYKQPEDEIAGMNMALGASVAGVRSMVATSGGGFALMVEGLSLAGIIETPLVIDLGMRAGPATGMPTYTEQGELRFAIHAGHGEFPRIILAPSDIVQAYSLTVEAFNLADRYQVPVFILTDKYLNESQWSVAKAHFQKEVTIDRGKFVTGSSETPEDQFKRYALDTPDGVSPRSAPGVKGGLFYANSYEHDETGHVTEDATGRKKMVEKRLRKFEAMQKDVQPPELFGDANAEITFVSWGSCKGPILEAIKLIQQKGKTARLVHFSWIYPFPTQEALKLLAPATRLVDVEQNATGQFASLVREHTGILIKEKLLKYDGRPFFPEEIVEGVN